MNSLPSVTFFVSAKNQATWLVKKRDYIEKRWALNQDGKKLLKRISIVCNMSFPKTIHTIRVSLEPYSKGGGYLGNTDAFGQPNEIALFVKKKHRYRDIKSTLCHELIHSICWCNTKYDQRRITPSFFADMFADELLTTILEAYIIKGRMSCDDYEWALDYARSWICESMKNLKRSKDYGLFIDDLRFFLKDYRNGIKHGSNLLLQREKVLTYIRSPRC